MLAIDVVPYIGAVVAVLVAGFGLIAAWLALRKSMIESAAASAAAAATASAAAEAQAAAALQHAEAMKGTLQEIKVSVDGRLDAALAEIDALKETVAYLRAKFETPNPTPDPTGAP